MTKSLLRTVPLCVPLAALILSAAPAPARPAAPALPFPSSPAHTAPALAPFTSDFSPTVMDDEDEKWIEQFLEILRRLYELLGGDPATMGHPTTPAGVNAAMATMTAYWGSLSGLPSLTPTQVAQAHSDVGSMQTMLLSKPAGITPGSFTTTLTSIDTALGY